MALEGSYSFDPATETDSRRRRRRIAEQLMAQGMETSPIQSPWQGAARMAQALMGGIELGMEDKKEREQLAAQTAYNSSITPALFGGGGEQAQPRLSMSPVAQAMMPPEQVKAIIDAHVPEEDRPFAYRMAEKESAFNPAAVSPTGAKGLFQFTGGTWGDVTGQSVGRGADGRTDPVANTKAFVELTRRNREALRGVLGRDPTPGELAVAHQQGVGGATALLTGKGTVNPRNLEVQAGNPKNAQDIMRYYGFAPDQGQGGPIQVAQAGGQTMNDGNARVQQLYAIANNPMTSPVNKKIALDEIERLRKGSDPAAALELQIKQEQLRKLREGPTVDPLTRRKQELDIQRAERELQGEGATPLTDAERQQYNIPKGQAAYKTRGGDIKFGPAGTTVKSEGAIPPGHRAIRDADGNIMSVEPIPGSKEAKAAVNKDRQQKTYANIVVGAIDDIDTKLATAKIPPTGFFGGVSSKIPGTASHDIANLVDTIKANISFERLNEMKAASPTGGALGAVSDQENKLLQRSLASLEQSQSPEQFRKNLDTVKNLYLDIIHGPGNRPASPADELKKKYGLE